MSVMSVLFLPIETYRTYWNFTFIRYNIYYSWNAIFIFFTRIFKRIFKRFSYQTILIKRFYLCRRYAVYKNVCLLTGFFFWIFSLSHVSYLHKTEFYILCKCIFWTTSYVVWSIKFAFNFGSENVTYMFLIYLNIYIINNLIMTTQ